MTATLSLERDVPLFLQEREAQRSKEAGPQDFDLQVQDMSKVRPGSFADRTQRSSAPPTPSLFQCVLNSCPEKK